MEDMDQPPSVFPSPTMDMDIQLPTPMVMTLPMDMARDQLRLRLNQVTDMLPATLTDLHRVSLDMEVMDMEDMVVTMAREMLSQVMVMLLLLTIHMEDPALSTEALKVWPEDMDMVIMAREMLSQAMDMAVVTLLSTSPALTIMVPMVITLTTPMAR